MGVKVGKFIDLTNQRFGFWKVINKETKNKSGQTQWLCECDCGNNIITCTYKLHDKLITSCGCKNIETDKKYISYVPYIPYIPYVPNTMAHNKPSNLLLSQPMVLNFI